MPVEARKVRPEYRTGYWMRTALPMVFGGLGMIILNRMDMLMLGPLAGAEAVGLFSAASRYARLNIFAATAIGVVVPPMIAAAEQRRDVRQQRTVLFWATLLSLAFALPMFLLMVAVPGWLLSFFGSGFAEAGPLLRVLAIGQFINAATGPVGDALIMVGRQKAFAWTTGLFALANVAGNLYAIPAFGAMGAAAVSAICATGMNLVLFYLFWSGRGAGRRSEVQAGE
jgi:O-antigen/teichoic acid export membrane protein